MTPIVSAIRSKNIGKLKFLVIQEKQDVNMRDEYGNSPLHVAVEYGTLKVLEFLIEVGADANTKTFYGEDALLYLAVLRESLEMTKLLVDHGADINARNAFGDAPLHTAVDKEAYQLVDFLVKSGAEIDIKDEHGCSPLHLAVKRSNFPIIKLLVEHGSDINLVDFNNQTSLYKAACYANELNFLIEKGASISSEGKIGLTPASFLKKASIIEYLSTISCRI
jgi:ankyrin repeat protein